MTDPDGRLVCPSCRGAARMDDLVLGVDLQGMYMEHVPCGYRARGGAPVLQLQQLEDDE